MTFEDQLKQEIISQYGSIRAFSAALGIKNSTLDSMLTRGLYNSGVGKVMQIFDALGIDTESISVGRIIYTKDKIENPPAPAEPEQGDNKVSRKAAEEFLTSYGFIKPGQSLGDNDLIFLDNLISILETWFKQRRESI